MRYSYTKGLYDTYVKPDLGDVLTDTHRDVDGAEFAAIA